MVFPPLKYTCILCLPCAFLKLWLRPLMYGATMLVFCLLETGVALFCWLVLLFSCFQDFTCNCFYLYPVQSLNGIFTS